MALLVRLLLMLVICASSLRPALGTQRADAALADALQDRTEAVSAVETDILALIESTPETDRFDLYRTYDRLMGTWVQVDLLRTLLELSAFTASPSEEEEIRADLRDHARFALWELEDARIHFERNAPDADGHERVRINEAIRSLLSQARTIISRLLVDQCVHVECVPGAL